jgi:hypothetical protein
VCWDGAKGMLGWGYGCTEMGLRACWDGAKGGNIDLSCGAGMGLRVEI